jgi:hypothetical protein
MKKHVIYVLIFATAFFGCSEDFLEPVRNTNVLTNEDIAGAVDNNPGLIEGSLDGIANFMVEPRGTLGGGANRHYDIGQKGVDILSDMVTGDCALSASTYGWYNGTANLLTTLDFTRQENQLLWDYYFRIVKSANTVILASGGNDADPENDNTRRILGQAKTYRAYAYFNLIQFFQPKYDPMQPILPFYDGVVSEFGKVEASRIYDLVISDLTQAISFLDGYTRTQKSQINKTVAQGLLAYTYAAMGNYSDAKVQSDAVINSSFPLLTQGQLAFPGAGSGFNDINTPAWIWGFDLTVDLGHQLIDWWGQMDYFTYSYAWAGDAKSIDDGLYAQIPSTDIRKTQFGNGFAALQPVNKFFDPGRTPGGQFVISTDLLFMRVEEFYLLSAECAARTGDESTALGRLTDLLEIRFTGGTAEASAYLAGLTGQSLLNEIYLQTRIEFWGEGKSFFAMKRNQATFQRGTNHVFRSGESITYDSDEATFEIPQTEINNNSSINDQNN